MVRKSKKLPVIYALVSRGNKIKLSAIEKFTLEKVTRLRYDDSIVLTMNGYVAGEVITEIMGSICNSHLLPKMRMRDTEITTLDSLIEFSGINPDELHAAFDDVLSKPGICLIKFRLAMTKRVEDEFISRIEKCSTIVSDNLDEIIIGMCGISKDDSFDNIMEIFRYKRNAIIQYIENMYPGYGEAVMFDIEKYLPYHLETVHWE